MKPIKDIDLKELQTSYDWAQVFCDENAGNMNDRVEEAPPGSKVSTKKVSRSMVKEIIAAINGANDGPDWIGLFLLKDGRYLVATGGCDYTGWDCRAFNRLVVARNKKEAIQFGLSEPERSRLGL